MLFLIFDVETIFLLPWAIIFMGDDFSFTKFALVEMFIFIGILIVGYYYAWRVHENLRSVESLSRSAAPVAAQSRRRVKGRSNKLR
jgi:hypothetical protein